jgi:hypothetical protein
MTHNYSKSIHKKLRELAGLAHERELSSALETLDSHFTQWRRQEIDCFELNDRIHSFHQKTFHELWKTYSSMEDDFLVGRAVKLGFFVQRKYSGKSGRGHPFGQSCIRIGQGS